MIKKLVLSFWALAIVLSAVGLYMTTHPDQTDRAALPNSTQEVCSVNAGEVLSLINAERVKLGSPALTVEQSLSISSRNKLEDMKLHKYYGHNQVNGASWVEFVRYQGVNSKTSEDININATSSTNTWNSFKLSPSHYQSLTSAEFTRVGIASECLDMKLEKSTGPENNTNLIGTTISDFTVVHLAAPEPQTQANTYTAPQPRYDYKLNMYEQPQPVRTSCKYYSITDETLCTSR